MNSALARLEELGDPEYERLAEINRRFVSLTMATQWSHLKATTNLDDWLPVLLSMGMDEQNVQSLALLAQQGHAGRCEANRLLWHWMNKVSMEGLSYIHAPSFFQKAIRNARHSIDAPPRDHKDWAAWEPGHALGPYWGVKKEFLVPPGPPSTPSPHTVQGPPAAPGPVLSPAPHTVPVQVPAAPMVTINMPGPMAAPAAAATPELPEPGGPWHVRGVQDWITGAWTTGWWYDRGAGAWKWHEAS